jgi:hypothetical protein
MIEITSTRRLQVGQDLQLYLGCKEDSQLLQESREGGLVFQDQVIAARQLDPEARIPVRARYGRNAPIVFSSESRERPFWGVDALGCLCSLRARMALDGVSWAQGG